MGEVFYQESVDGTKVVDILSIQADTASRIMALGSAGQTLMTRGVFDNARAILRSDEIPDLNPLTWLDHGAYRFKGVAEPLGVCEVGEEGFAPLTRPPDSEKAYHYISPDDEPVLGWRPSLQQLPALFLRFVQSALLEQDFSQCQSSGRIPSLCRLP